MTDHRKTNLKDALEEDIATGRLAPGERLDEVSLGQRFGVSRTPIREALQQLAAVGLVEIRPHRGAVVATADPHRLVEMFEVMAELEGMAVRLASRRHTEADMTRIRAAHEACRRAARKGDTDAYYYENERFHHAIYEASHNGFLIEQCRLLHRRLKPYRRLQLRVRRRMAASLAEHEAIVEALAAFDGERAEQLLREHISVQGERFTDLIASLARERADAE